MATRSGALAAVLVAGLLPAAGCGSGDPPEPDPRPVETIEKPVKLPDRWTRHTNAAGGLELGLPPGWKARDRGTTTRIRSFDEVVVLSIAPDRTSEALDYDLGEFATATLTSLQGYEGELDPGKPRPFKHQYDGAEATTTATSSATGAKQEISVIVLRRPKLAVFTVVVQSSARPDAGPARELAEDVVKTLRSRPLS